MAATILDLLLGTVPQGLDGESLLPLLEGGTDPDAGAPELFDLRSDPGETRNLADAEPVWSAALQEQADRLTVGPLRGLGDGEEDFASEGLPDEAVEALRALGYVEG